MDRRTKRGSMAMLPGLALVALASAGCTVAEAVSYLDVEPSTRQDGRFIVDAGLLPEGGEAAFRVEFWNVSDRPWRMEFEPPDDGVPVVWDCEQEYDCTYVAPRRHSVWTFRVDPGPAGSEQHVDLGVVLTDDETGELLDYRTIRLQWMACGPQGPSCS